MKKETQQLKQPTLYIVATPIGNLKDITLRALEVLAAVDIIVCEDTRVTKKLLYHYQILPKELISYGKHNLNKTTHKVIDLLLQNYSVALVSDAGTPLISDPGAELVQECHNKNIKVTTIPGASSLISALTLSGITSKDFYFGGFLENKSSSINKQFLKTKNMQTTAVYFIAANKLVKALEQIINVFGENQLVILVREITKLFEEVIFESAGTLLTNLSTKNILGEVVLILPPGSSNVEADTSEVEIILKEAMKTLNFKDAIAYVVSYYNNKNIKINKKKVYELALNIKQHL